jgi:GAF domain-containing protein
VSRYTQSDACDAALVDLIEKIEARGQQSFVASVLVLQGRKLQHAAAPGLPARYRAAIDGIEIGPATGSCGTAAFCGHPGLRACWSMPIVLAGKVLGTFAIYHREPRSPTVAERELIAEAARAAASLLGARPGTHASNVGATCS